MPEIKMEPRAAVLRVVIFWKLWRRWLRKRPRAGIPTYRSNGRRVSDSSIERALRLEAMGHVSLKRSKAGRITGCQFIAETLRGADPIHKTAHMGQRYSFLRRVSEYANPVWQHKAMYEFSDPLELEGVPATERADAERYLRSVFLAVPISCLTEPPPPAASGGKVIPFPKKTKAVAQTPRRDALMRHVARIREEAEAA